MVSSSWGLGQKDRLFIKIEVLLSLPGAQEKRGTDARLPTPNSLSPTSIPQAPAPECHQVPRTSSFTRHQGAPRSRRPGLQRASGKWVPRAPGPPSRDGGLDALTVPSCPKCDHIWGRRKPRDCVWKNVNTDTPGQAWGCRFSPGTPGNFLINSLQSRVIEALKAAVWPFCIRRRLVKGLFRGGGLYGGGIRAYVCMVWVWACTRAFILGVWPHGQGRPT